MKELAIQHYQFLATVVTNQLCLSLRCEFIIKSAIVLTHIFPKEFRNVSFVSTAGGILLFNP